MWYWYFALIVILLYTLLIGLREVSIGVDIHRYIRAFAALDRMSGSEVIAVFRKDSAFYLFAKYLVYVVGVRGAIAAIALFVVASIVVLIYYVGAKRRISLLMLYATMPAVYDLGGNVLRQGVSVSILLLAAAAMYRGAKIVPILLAVVAVGMHLSSIIVVVLAVVAMLCHARLAIIVFIMCLAMSFAGIGFHLLDAGLVIDVDTLGLGGRFGRYTQVDQFSYRTGFRLDFVTYTVLPVIAALSYRVHQRRPPTGNASMWYDVVFKLYLLIGGVFFLCFGIPYSDRVGMYAWILIPLVVLGGMKRGKMILPLQALWVLSALSIVAINLYMIIR